MDYLCIITFMTLILAVKAPISCHMTGDYIKQVDEQVNLTCETRIYGDISSSMRWSAPWFHIPVHKIKTSFDINNVGHRQTVLHRRVSEVDDGQVYTCNLRYYNDNSINDSCTVSYSVQSCKKSTRCVVHPFRNGAGMPGDSVTLSTTIRKQAVNDWMAVSWTSTEGQQRIIWQENDTSVILPDYVTVETSMDKSTLHSTYNITIQLPKITQTFLRNNALINATGTYNAYMISYPIVKTTAKVAAVDDVSCKLTNGPEIIAGQRAKLTCYSEYIGHTTPVLSWFNESGHPVSETSSYYRVGGGPFEVSISPKASGLTDGIVFQCSLKYNVTEFDYFPPLYQDTCNTSFTVLYGTKCTMNGGPVKKPGDPVELTCTTKYDGVNIPEMDWYRHGDTYSKNLTSRVEVNNVTREYKVYMSTTAGTKDESFQCRLRYYYHIYQWREERVKEACVISYKSSVVSDGALFSVQKYLVSVALLLQTFLTLCSK